MGVIFDNLYTRNSVLIIKNEIFSTITILRYDGNNVAAGPSSSFAHSKISLADFRGNPMVVGSGDPDNKTVEIMYGGWSPQPDFPYVDKR